MTNNTPKKRLIRGTGTLTLSGFGLSAEELAQLEQMSAEAQPKPATPQPATKATVKKRTPKTGLGR